MVLEKDAPANLESAWLTCLMSIDNAKASAENAVADDFALDQLVREAGKHAGRLLDPKSQHVLWKRCQRLLAHLRASAAYTPRRLPIRAHIVSRLGAMSGHWSNLYSKIVTARVSEARPFVMIGRALSKAVLNETERSEQLTQLHWQPLVTIQANASQGSSIFFLPGAGDAASTDSSNDHGTWRGLRRVRLALSWDR